MKKNASMLLRGTSLVLSILFLLLSISAISASLTAPEKANESNTKEFRSIVTETVVWNEYWAIYTVDFTKPLLIAREYISDDEASTFEGQLVVFRIMQVWADKIDNMPFMPPIVALTIGDKDIITMESYNTTLDGLLSGLKSFAILCAGIFLSIAILFFLIFIGVFNKTRFILRILEKCVGTHMLNRKVRLVLLVMLIVLILVLFVLCEPLTTSILTIVICALYLVLYFLSFRKVSLSINRHLESGDYEKARSLLLKHYKHNEDPFFYHNLALAFVTGDHEEIERQNIKYSPYDYKGKALSCKISKYLFDFLNDKETCIEIDYLVVAYGSQKRINEEKLYLLMAIKQLKQKSFGEAKDTLARISKLSSFSCYAFVMYTIDFKANLALGIDNSNTINRMKQVADNELLHSSLRRLMA